MVRLAASLLLVLGFMTIPAQARAACVDYTQNLPRLTELEGDASRGALSAETKACLESSYSSAQVQTAKGKISRVLLVNAYALDTTTWAKLVQRHLDEVERSDPNIAYLYSFYLYNRRPPNYDEVIKWADVALERRTEWVGDVLVTRAFQLHRIRSYAAYDAWRVAEEGQKSNSEELRNRAKTFAREWMDFARDAKRDGKEAEQLCISAASRPACGLN